MLYCNFKIGNGFETAEKTALKNSPINPSQSCYGRLRYGAHVQRRTIMLVDKEIRRKFVVESLAPELGPNVFLTHEEATGKPVLC